MAGFLTINRENEYCSKLASYLKEHINTEFAKEVEASGGTINEGTLVIRTVRNYDAVNVSLADFPLLKVYRTSCNYRPGSPFRTCQGAVVWQCSYPQLDVLPNLLTWMDLTIATGLMKYDRDILKDFPRSNSQGYVSQYLLTANELTQAVYPFLRFSIEFKDFLDVCNY